MANESGLRETLEHAVRRTASTVCKATMITRCLGPAIQIYESMLQLNAAPVCESLSADNLRLIHRLQNELTERLLSLDHFLRMLAAIQRDQTHVKPSGKELIPNTKVIRLAVWRAKQSSLENLYQAMEQLYNMCRAIDSISSLLEQKLRDVLDSLAGVRAFERSRSS